MLGEEGWVALVESGGTFLGKTKSSLFWTASLRVGVHEGVACMQSLDSRSSVLN